MTRALTTPSLYDGRRRVPRGARMKAYRCDTHTFVEEAEVDSDGQASFTAIPEGVNTVYHTIWSGVTGRRKYQWFPIRFMQIEDGGTGATTEEDARTNLGCNEASMLWAIVF